MLSGFELCSRWVPLMNEHNNTITKPQAKKHRFLKLSQKFPVEKQQLVEEKVQII